MNIQHIDIDININILISKLIKSKRIISRQILSKRILFRQIIDVIRNLITSFSVLIAGLLIVVNKMGILNGILNGILKVLILRRS